MWSLFALQMPHTRTIHRTNESFSFMYSLPQRSPADNSTFEPWLLIDRIFVVTPHKMNGTGPETRPAEITTIGTWTFKALPYN
jgi:hypothetical protein